MSRHTVEEWAYRELALDREDRICPVCGGGMHIRSRRSRRILTLDGPLQLSVGLVQCYDERCEHRKLYSPEQECGLAMPRWGIGWDVFCWIGQRRFSRHWSVPQIRNELRDTYDLKLSADAIEDHIAAYQTMVAARHQDSQQMATVYETTKDIVLSIDGLQPEKGHETLYVVREVTQNRVWFAEPLLSGATDEIRKLILRAKEIAVSLGLNVVLWMSDKQDAFVKCVADEFSDVPHRFCMNHFCRDLAKPILAMDSTAKKKMRAKIRGLRELEREVLEAQQGHETVSGEDVVAIAETPQTSSLAGDGGAVVLDFCSAVRGILNDNHGGPCQPPGIRMVDALADVQESLARIAASGEVGPAFSLLDRLKGFIDRGVAEQQDTFSRVRAYTADVRAVVEILTVDDGASVAGREPLFAAKLAEFQSFPDDQIYHGMAKMMTSFQVGLFAGPDLTCFPHDNLDIERWFRGPKSHERRIHGHKHAGIRIVREGATLIPTLDAHAQHPGVFTEQDLTGFATAAAPASQLASQQRHGVMKKARSKKKNHSPETARKKIT
jgi:hypothetical protein